MRQAKFDPLVPLRQAAQNRRGRQHSQASYILAPAPHLDMPLYGWRTRLVAVVCLVDKNG
jgi:hypothetical protein